MHEPCKFRNRHTTPHTDTKILLIFSFLYYPVDLVFIYLYDASRTKRNGASETEKNLSLLFLVIFIKLNSLYIARATSWRSHAESRHEHNKIAKKKNFYFDLNGQMDANGILRYNDTLFSRMQIKHELNSH